MTRMHWLAATVVATIAAAPLAFGDPAPAIQPNAMRALQAHAPAVQSPIDALKQQVEAQQQQIATQQQQIAQLQVQLAQDHAQLTTVANTLFKLQARFATHYHPTKTATVYVQTLNCTPVGGAGGGGLSCQEGSKQQVLSGVGIQPPAAQ